jgi:hypothetical protein
VPAARNDLAVNFHRHALTDEPEALKQRIDRERRVELLFLAVELDFHEAE